MGGQAQEQRREEGAEEPEGIWAEEPSSFLVRGESAELWEKASDSRSGCEGMSKGCGGGGEVWPGLAQAMTS